MMRARTIALILATAGLSACATAGPDYSRPSHSVATTPTATGAFVSAGAGTSQAELPDHWWRLYADPKLDALVDQALAANTDLRVADANLRRADAVVREAKAGRTISTSVTGDLGIAGTGADVAGPTSYDIGLSASYPLDLRGKISRAIEAAQAGAEATAAARDAVRIAVAAATTKAYIDVCAANYRLGVNQRVVELQRRTLTATQRLQKGGRGTAFDVSRAQAAVDQSAANLPHFLGERQAALYLLATLGGKPPADYPRDIADCPSIPTLSQAMPVGDGAALIRRRPDIRAAERTIAADTAIIGVATADLYPSVSIGGSIGWGGLVRDADSRSSFGFSLGPLLSWSFPNRPVVKARIAEAGAQVEADVATFDSIVLEALRQTETSLETYRRSGEAAAALSKARDSAALSADQANRLFRFGRSDFLSLLEAQRNLASAEAAHAEARAQLADNQIAVFVALGGGWASSPEP
jgi:NodT family efflux transporter outer membrane factor (OMF) lipoprotein